MPIHDWKRVSAGIFHDFHNSWIVEIKKVLNTGILPQDYYALAEQVAGPFGPDVLTLGIDASDDIGEPANGTMRGTKVVATEPPQAFFTAQTEMDQYVQKQNAVVIRHSSGDRIVALIEVLSPGNKATKHALNKFLEKAASALFQGYHLLLLDLHAPGRRDSEGIHGALWEEIADDTYRAPQDRPLTLAAYDAGPPKTAYVTPVAVGAVLPPMPLFLEPGAYVTVPVESAYEVAFQAVPRRWRRVLEPVEPTG